MPNGHLGPGQGVPAGCIVVDLAMVDRVLQAAVDNAEEEKKATSFLLSVTVLFMNFDFNSLLH